MRQTVTTEFEMFRLFEMTPDLVCVASKEGFFKHINDAVVKTLGYSREELLTRPIFSFLHPDDLESTRRTREQMLKGKALINFDNRYITKSGDVVWLNWTSIYLPENEIVFAIAKNITKRKYIEIEVEEKYNQFRNLATHFKASMEDDKKYLAAELHEQLAQLASAVKIDLEWLRDNVSMNETALERLNHASSITQMLINGIRKISYDISPGMIEEMGLIETLKWLCDEYAKFHGVQCRFESNYDDSILSSEVQIDLYRIAQKLLKNVIDHADARVISINVEAIGELVSLSVNDDGKGFDTSKIEEIPALTGLRKRAASINGELLVESTPGNGSRITVIIPT